MPDVHNIQLLDGIIAAAIAELDAVFRGRRQSTSAMSVALTLVPRRRGSSGEPLSEQCLGDRLRLAGVVAVLDVLGSYTRRRELRALLHLAVVWRG
jgi:hypothetical protein